MHGERNSTAARIVGIWQASGSGGSDGGCAAAEENGAIFHFAVQATPRLRAHALCAKGDCDANGAGGVCRTSRDFWRRADGGSQNRHLLPAPGSTIANHSRNNRRLLNQRSAGRRGQRQLPGIDALQPACPPMPWWRVIISKHQHQLRCAQPAAADAGAQPQRWQLQQEGYSPNMTRPKRYRRRPHQHPAAARTAWFPSPASRDADLTRSGGRQNTSPIHVPLPRNITSMRGLVRQVAMVSLVAGQKPLGCHDDRRPTHRA